MLTRCELLGVLCILVPVVLRTFAIPEAQTTATDTKAGATSSGAVFDAAVLEVQGNNDARKDLQLFQQLSSCYQQSVSVLQNSCESALEADEVKQTIALQFTSCFYEASGRGLFPADADTSRLCTKFKEPIHSDDRAHVSENVAGTVKSCIKALDAAAYDNYIKFYIRVEDICRYAQAENFQKKTVSLIHHLFTSSELANKELESLAESSAVAEQRLQSIIDLNEDVSSRLEDAIDGQEELLRSQRNLSELSLSVYSLATSIQHVLQNDLASLHGHTERLHSVVGSILAKVETGFSLLDRWHERSFILLSEIWFRVWTAQTIAFYIFLTASMWLLSMTIKSLRANRWLLLIELMAFYFAETELFRKHPKWCTTLSFGWDDYAFEEWELTDLNPSVCTDFFRKIVFSSLGLTCAACVVFHRDWKQRYMSELAQTRKQVDMLRSEIRELRKHGQIGSDLSVEMYRTVKLMNQRMSQYSATGAKSQSSRLLSSAVHRSRSRSRNRSRSRSRSMYRAPDAYMGDSLAAKIHRENAHRESYGDPCEESRIVVYDPQRTQ